MNPKQTPLFEIDESKFGDTWFQEIANSLDIDEAPGWPDRFGISLRECVVNRIEKPIRTLSLFSGGGGLDIAFHDAGFDIVEMVEIDERFVQSLLANSDEGKRLEHAKPICVDIRDYDPSFPEPIDFIVGGPPCQTFSAAGRRAAGVNGTTEDRGMLFWEYVRILKKLSPKGFLFENVYGITGSRGGKDWKVIISAFEDAGYKVFYRILDAADYGVPQQRERLIIVGLKSGTFKFPRPTHGADSPGTHRHFSSHDAICDLEPDEDLEGLTIGGRYGHLLNEIPPGLNYSFFTEKMGHPIPLFAWRSKFSDFLYKADPERPTRTIKALGGQYTGPFHWESRRFTIAELKRLQTFPDDYVISGGRQAQIEQIGNSVPPQLGRMLAVSVLSQLFRVDLPFKMALLNPDEKLGFRKRKREMNSIYRMKAQEALKQRKSSKPKKLNAREYFASLSQNFSLIEYANGDSSEMLVKFQPNANSWDISVSKLGPNPDRDEKIDIVVEPKPGLDWSLGINNVHLTSNEINGTIFTALWKAFEAELIRGRFKADLVQLNAYYQYSPRLALSMNYEMQLDNDLPLAWDVVKYVVSGIGVKRVIPSSALADIWQVDIDDVIEHGLFLRGLGYEVRNWNTNPQIPNENFLIPYAFPTLTPQSVQLRKSLK